MAGQGIGYNIPLHRVWCPDSLYFNESHTDWPQQCSFRHREYHWPGVLAPKTNTLIGDSIIKYVRDFPETYVQAYPGANVECIMQKIETGAICLYGYRFIMFHLGSNNLHNQEIGGEEMYHKFKHLLLLARSMNPGAALVLSEILPRTYEDEGMLHRRMGVNQAMEQLAEELWGVYYFRTYKAVTQVGSLWADPKFFAMDGLHVNELGTWALWKSINGNIITLKGKIKEHKRL